MRTEKKCINPSRPTPPNVFTSEFLEEISQRDEVLTSAEAEFAGPWKTESVPGQPGAVAVLREWENLEEGDTPHAIFWNPETAELLKVALPILDREPMFHLGEVDEPEGVPVTAVYGEQGPVVVGWIRCGELRTVEALHLLEGIVRSPRTLATLLEAAGWGAIEQVGRILASRRPKK